MTSLVDLFINGAVPISNTVIGSTSVTLSNGVVLNGVWSSFNSMAESFLGGEQFEISGSVIVPAASNINKGLVGKRCTYNGISLQVSNVDIGTTETTVYFKEDTEGLKL